MNDKFLQPTRFCVVFKTLRKLRKYGEYFENLNASQTIQEIYR